MPTTSTLPAPAPRPPADEARDLRSLAARITAALETASDCADAYTYMAEEATDPALVARWADEAAGYNETAMALRAELATVRQLQEQLTARVVASARRQGFPIPASLAG